MPKSKRDKKVSLTRTAKHGKEWKKDIYEKVRSAAEQYASIYVIRVDGMRVGALNEIRKHFKDSTILLAKNKVMALALGKDEASEVSENTYKIAERLTGQCGLLFTDREESDVISFIEEFVERDYARSGTKAKEEVILKEGPLTQFSHAIEPHLRSLGMPTQLKKGIVTLLQDFTVCKKRQVLTPQQANILKLLEIQMAQFKIKLDSKWTKPDEFKILASKDDDESEEEEEEDDDIAEDDDPVQITDEEMDASDDDDDDE